MTNLEKLEKSNQDFLIEKSNLEVNFNKKNKELVEKTLFDLKDLIFPKLRSVDITQYGVNREVKRLDLQSLIINESSNFYCKWTSTSIIGDEIHTMKNLLYIDLLLESDNFDKIFFRFKLTFKDSKKDYIYDLDKYSNIESIISFFKFTKDLVNELDNIYPFNILFDLVNERKRDLEKLNDIYDNKFKSYKNAYKAGLDKLLNLSNNHYKFEFKRENWNKIKLDNFKIYYNQDQDTQICSEYLYHLVYIKKDFYENNEDNYILGFYNPSINYSFCINLNKLISIEDYYNLILAIKNYLMYC